MFIRDTPPPAAHHRLDRLTDPLTEIAYLRRALTLIGTHCTIFTAPFTCTNPTFGRSPYARYTADQWCEPCIARTALTGAEFPARGTTGVEETTDNNIIDATHPTPALPTGYNTADSSTDTGPDL